MLPPIFSKQAAEHCQKQHKKFKEVMFPPMSGCLMKMMCVGFHLIYFVKVNFLQLVSSYHVAQISNLNPDDSFRPRRQVDEAKIKVAIYCNHRRANKLSSEFSLHLILLLWVVLLSIVAISLVSTRCRVVAKHCPNL